MTQVKIEEGKMYVTTAGNVIGPAKWCSDSRGPYPWCIGGYRHYSDSGTRHPAFGSASSHISHEYKPVQAQEPEPDDISMDREYAQRADPFTKVQVLTCTANLYGGDTVVYLYREVSLGRERLRSVSIKGRFSPSGQDSDSDLVPLRKAPKELWRNEYPCVDGGFVHHTAESAACTLQADQGGVTVHYREVTE